jgi:hypothetical protein
MSITEHTFYVKCCALFLLFFFALGQKRIAKG